jgi:hypothetical protein
MSKEEVAIHYTIALRVQEELIRVLKEHFEETERVAYRVLAALLRHVQVIAHYLDEQNGTKKKKGSTTTTSQPTGPFNFGNLGIFNRLQSLGKMLFSNDAPSGPPPEKKVPERFQPMNDDYIVQIETATKDGSVIKTLGLDGLKELSKAFEKIPIETEKPFEAPFQASAFSQRQLPSE